MNMNPDQRYTLINICLIIVLGFAVYANSLSGQFIWDDEFLVLKNPHIRSWTHLPKLFTGGLAAGRYWNLYRPVQMFTYMADFFFWGLNPKGYHLTNTVLHVLTALLLYAVINLLFQDRLLSFLTVAFFTSHPIHTEAVSYISGRADSLAAVFMLAAFLLLNMSISSEVAMDPGWLGLIMVSNHLFNPP